MNPNVSPVLGNHKTCCADCNFITCIQADVFSFRNFPAVYKCTVRAVFVFYEVRIAYLLNDGVMAACKLAVYHNIVVVFASDSDFCYQLYLPLVEHQVRCRR